MFRLIILSFVMLFASCSKSTETKAINSHAGVAYIESFYCGICRDLTDEEMDEADRLEGNGYRDASKAVEESEEYAAQHVFDSEEGIIFILEDDGELTEIEA